MTSPAEFFVQRLAQQPDALDILASLTIQGLDGAALFYDWEEFWARPQQLPPEGPWRSFGAFGGRGGGKTRMHAEIVQREVRAGRANHIALIAQNEDKVWEVMIEGKSGLIATSPPWFRATTHNGQVVWPNGARASVFTPERPDDIFGPEHDLAWASEIHAWPRSTMQKAFSNLRMGLRLGYARLLWDSNPRRRHPLLKMLIDRSVRAPERHPIARLTTFDNVANLSPDAIAEWVEEYSGTREADEMLRGLQFDDDDAALFRQAWIDGARRHMPAKFRRRVLSLDPAVSILPGTDATGLVESAEGVDGQFFVIADLSERVEVDEWARKTVQRYFASRCDCCIVERNRGGDLPVSMLRAVCRDLGFELVDLPLDAVCHGHVPAVMHVKQVVSRQSKEVRAEGVAPLYKAGRVSHVIEADLGGLEDEMTTWVPGPKVESPNRLDAMVHGLWELAGLWDKRKKDPSAVSNAAAVQAAVNAGGVVRASSGIGAALAARLRGMGGTIL